MTSQAPQEKGPVGLLAELRRRRVLRVAGTYGVVAGSLMQAGAVILPAFELPNSAMRLMILSLAAGFPLAILLAWLLDISPHGIRLARRRRGRAGNPDDEGEEQAAEASVFARSLEMLLLGLALPVLAFSLIVLVMSWRSGGEELVATAARSEQTGVASLAVLPLEDLSQDEVDGGFFARGMHEDVLAQLARLPKLKLISRTSVMGYAGSAKSLREIGRELGVDHVLEGSVRRSGERVRVTAQLIRIEDDAHVWAEQFDAELSDVFEVQARIAGAIARALERELIAGETEPVPASFEVVPAAYDAYQKARDLHRNLDPSDRATFEEAQHLYEEARLLDGSFAPAWLQLAILHAEARWFGLDRSPARIEQARRCLAEARRLASPADQLALAEGIFAYYVDEDYGKALLFFDDAARLAPAGPEAPFYRAMILRRRSEHASALAAIRTALELDPLNFSYRDEYALSLALAGELEAARRELASILTREPGRARAQVQAWQLELELTGNPEGLLDRLLASDRTRWFDPHFAMLETAAILADGAERALPALARPIAGPIAEATLALQQAGLERIAGRSDEAGASLARARHAFDGISSAGASPLARMELRQLEAMILAAEGRLDEAVAIATRNVEDFPIERDLITGTPVLWQQIDLALRAGRIELAIAALDRLAARVALGSVPFGGHYVLAQWPLYRAARDRPEFAAWLARARPAYAADWILETEPSGEASP